MTLQAQKPPVFDFSEDATSSEYVIEQNVPIPPRRLPQCSYPFDKMKVGDSFFAPNKNSGTVSGSARNWIDRNNSKAHFTVRQIGKDGCRCWRDK